MKEERKITIQELIERTRKRAEKKKEGFVTYRWGEHPLYFSNPFIVDNIWGKALTDIDKNDAVFITSTGSY